MKEIDKNNYYPHGKALDFMQYNILYRCQCCNNQLTYEEKQELGYDAKLCKVCLTSPIIIELLL